MTRLACSLALALATLLGAGAPAAAAPGWQWSKPQRKLVADLEQTVAHEGERFTLEGAHWRVETEVSARFTAELTLFMDLFHEAFHKLLEELEPTAVVERKPTVVVFATKERYAREFSDGSRGHYRYHWDEHGTWDELHLYTFIEKPEEREFAQFYQPILLHEGTHVLLRCVLGQNDCPVWFDEGVATYFQFWDLRLNVSQNLKTRYARSFYRGRLKEAYARELPDLPPLLAVESKAWNPDSMGPIAERHYALAESVIDALLGEPKGRPVFKALFDRLKQGETPLLSRDETVDLELAWHRRVVKVVLR